MGLLDFIFGKKVLIQDEFFGEMIFFKNKKNPQKSHFACSRQFAPINADIEIAIQGNISESIQNQKEFFKQIERSYNQIIRSITPIIEDEFKNWKEDFKIVDFKSEFIPHYIHLYNFENQSINWEIVFESDHDLNHHFTVKMNDLVAQELLIDG